MKLGLAVLPMDVWADVFVYPWITREQLAQIVDQFKERAFAEKLQKFLHNPRCGKHSLRFLKIFYKPKENSQRRATLAVAPQNGFDSDYKDCEFPEVEMPENIKNFKQLTIGHYDDQVLEFLNKIKPLFINVLLYIESVQSAKNLRILFTYLLPMLAIGSHRIRCKHVCIKFIERHFPGTLERAIELHLTETATNYIPEYLDWLSTPLYFNVHGPRLLIMNANSRTIMAMVNAVRKQFSDATTPSAFVIFLEFYQIFRADELSIENAATNEKLTVRNAIFNKTFGFDVNYVEILRHPMGADAKMREWIEQRAYYKNLYSYKAEPEQIISIDGHYLTVGQVAKRAGAVNQDNDQPEDEGEDEAGPSTSAKKMK